MNINPENHEVPRASIGFVKATPTLSIEQMELATTGTDAIVFEVFATGTAPERLIPFVKSKVDSGTPVFLLSDNRGDNHGILKIIYEPQFNYAKAGAVALEKVNINKIDEVLAYIQ